MTTAARWGSKLFVDWRPILTFARRELQLLDWLEKNIDVAAFNNDDAGVGIAVASRDQRLIVQKSGLLLELRSPKAEASVLTEAIRGVWRVMEPYAPTVQLHQSTWSVPVDREYDEARTALAQRTASSLEEEAGEVFDCANLVDVRTRGGRVTVEFGIVSAEELHTRLSTPAAGRIQERTGLARPAFDVDTDDLPQTSMFADAYWSPAPRPAPLESADAVVGALETTGEEVERLVVGLHRALP